MIKSTRRCREWISLSSNISQHDFFDLIERHPVAPAIIELCRPRAFVRRHLLGVFEQTAIRQVNRDAGCPEGVAAQRRCDPSIARAAPTPRPSRLRPSVAPRAAPSARIESNLSRL